jgi:hypothetical protein
VLRTVRHQIVNDHGNRLGLRGGEHDVRIADRRVGIGRVGRKLVAYEVGKAYAGPAALA